jgi:hypothetical protein
VQAKADENLARQASALSRDCARLIQKLRWIGLDKEARQLESALDGLPPEERSGFNFDPVDTD